MIEYEGRRKTWVIIRGLERKSYTGRAEPAADPVMEPEAGDPSTREAQGPSEEHRLRPALLALVVTLVLAGTLFFLVPNGLSAWIGSLPAYLDGWLSAASMTPGRMLFTLLVYEPLGLFFGILALVRGFRTGSRRIIRLGVWLGVSLLLGVFYRQVGELAWVPSPADPGCTRDLPQPECPARRASGGGRGGDRLSAPARLPVV